MKARTPIIGMLTVLWLIFGGMTVEAGMYYATGTNVNLCHVLNASAIGGNAPWVGLSYQQAYQNDIWGASPGSLYQIDLGLVQNVGIVQIQNYGGVYDATSYRIDYSTNNVDWITATNVPAIAPMPYRADLGGAPARYVRLVGQAFNPDAAGQWVLRKADIYASSSSVPIRGTLSLAGSRSNGGQAFLDGNPAPLLNDEDPSYAYIGAPGDPPHSIVLQLREAYKLTSVRWNSFWAGICSYPTNYTIETRLGGGGWTQVYAYSGSTVGFFYSDTFTGDYGTSGILADQVRITVNGVSVSSLNGFYCCDIEVFGDAYGVTNYVSRTSPSPTPPFTNWATAAHDIQSAIDAIPDGNTVVVTDDTYTVSSQITLVRPVTVQSVHGSSKTFVGGAYPASTNRCFYIGNAKAVLDGFTITNGYLTSGSGAGVYIDANGAVRNCTISANTAVGSSGGGVMFNGGGLLDNCNVCNNFGNSGGGAFCSGGGTISQCNIFSNTVPDYGYGIGVYMSGGGLICSNSAIYLNGVYKAWGGGVAMSSGGVVQDCVISNNYCEMGGGIETYGSGPQVLHCIIVDNSVYYDAYGAGFGVGGGVSTWTTGASVISNCLISGNYCRMYGGGIYSSDDGIVVDCAIQNNTAASGGGGGVYFADGGYMWGNIVQAKPNRMERCTVSGNTSDASNGGGVYGPGKLKYCVIRGNTAGYPGYDNNNGGGVYLPTLLQNCTIAGNTNLAPAGKGGGVYMDSSGAMTNCIVCFNTASFANNITNNGGTVAYTCSTPLPDGTGNISADPRFVDLAGGDVHEKSRAGHWTVGDVWVMDDVQSPCIDAGVPYDPANPASYFSSEPRPNGGRINMGAYGNTPQASKTWLGGTVILLQ